MIHIDLYGDPVPSKRPRFVRRGKFVSTYDSQATLKENFRWQIKSQYREKPLTSPICLDIIFYMPIPKSTSKKKKRQMLNGICFHMIKPDIDNMQKFLMDCLNEIVFDDDSQVVQIRCKKVYSEKPGTLIRVFPIEQFQTHEELHASDTRISR